MMANPILRFAEAISGHWALNLETKVPRVELYEKRIASSKPSLGFLVVNAPEDLLDETAIRKMQANMLNRSRQLGLDDIKFSLSVVPNRVYRFELDSDLKR